MEANQSLGSRISKLRKSKGMTQRQLAELLYVSGSTVSKWETNEAMPDLLRLKELAGILEVSVSELLGEEIYFEQDSFVMESEESSLRTSCPDNSEPEERCLEESCLKESLTKENGQEVQSGKRTKMKQGYVKYTIIIIAAALVSFMCIGIGGAAGVFPFAQDKEYQGEHSFDLTKFEVVDAYLYDTTDFYGHESVYLVVAAYKGYAEQAQKAAFAASLEVETTYAEQLEQTGVVAVVFCREYPGRGDLYREIDFVKLYQ